MTESFDLDANFRYRIFRRADRFARASTDNFHRISEHIDATRPDLVVNSGDVSWDGPTSRSDLEFAKELHDGAAGGLPAICPAITTSATTRPRSAPRHRTWRTKRIVPSFIDVFGEDRWQFEAAGWCFIGLNSLIMNTGIRERGRAGRVAAIAALRCERQADRAVSAQAAISE